MSLAVGDRVRLASGRRCAQHGPGTEGTITYVPARGHWVGVLFDGGKHERTPNPDRLVRIETMTMIDPTQPLELYQPNNRRYKPAPVTLICVTQSGDITVGHQADQSALGSDFRWAIFNREGRFVRSETSTGTALRLRNSAPAVTHRFKIDVVDGSPYFTPMEPGGVCDLQITTKGEKLVSAVARADLA